MKKTLLSLVWVFWGSLGWAGNPIGLEVWGVPEGSHPVIADRLHTALLYTGREQVMTGPAVRQWFWQPAPDERHIRVVFTHYYSGGKQKIVLPLVSARYSFVLCAEGTAAVYSPHGDSLLFRAPFEFRFERPVSYQVVGVHADLPSAQMPAPTQALLEGQALDSLTTVLVTLLESGNPSPAGAAMNLEELAREVGELAQRTRLDAINLAVAAAKVKLSDPGFKQANERIIQLVTRATEVAGRVDRLTRQMAGDPQDENVVETGLDTMSRLEACLREVEELSTGIVDEVRRLSATHSTLRQSSGA